MDMSVFIIKETSMIQRESNKTTNNEQNYDIICVTNIYLITAIKMLAEKVNKKCQEGWKREGTAVITVGAKGDFSAAHAIAKIDGQETKKATENKPKYDIICISNMALDEAIRLLVEEVNKKCKYGWKREGTVIIISETDRNFVVAQAITKE